jgi:hypothetical protein
MIVYFKWFSNLLMAVGGILGALAGYLYLGGNILGNKSRVAVFILALFIFAGIILFRILGAVIATGRLKKVLAKLYQDADPQGFLREFEPMNARVPRNLAEYANGQNHISFAREALGDFAGAEEAIRDLQPENLKLHALTTTALLTNQKTNLSILSGNTEAAQTRIEDLRTLAGAAEKRAAMLKQNLETCIRLQTARLKALQGSEDADTEYLREEIRLSSNLIHKKEIQLELAEYCLKTGKVEEGRKLLQEILQEEKGLHSEQRARELLKEVD